MIRVAVDPTNPGQFFACCGLLELADRLWPGAEGCFAEGGREFCVTFSEEQGTLKELLATLVKDSPKEILVLECNGLAVKPIVAPLAFTFRSGPKTVVFLLDVWSRIQNIKGVVQVIGNSPWNFWSGQQTSSGIWSGLRKALVAHMRTFQPEDFDSLFAHRLFQKGRFGFDPGPAWNPLDVGFSPNEQAMEVESSAAVELLAAVGLQRFRPVMHGRESFDYSTWHHPLSPSVAAAAICNAIPDSHSVRYRGCVVSRGQYAALGVSFPIREGASRE